MSEQGPTIIDHETGEAVDGGCAKHSTHWLAKSVRANRRNLDMSPQECERRPTCPVPLANEEASI